MTPDEVLIYLRHEGITVHLVSSDDVGGLIIFLEANLGQMEFAEYLMRQLPAVGKTYPSAAGILRVSRKP